MRINKRTTSSIKRLNTFGLSFWEHNLYHIGEQNPEEKYITLLITITNQHVGVCCFTFPVDRSTVMHKTEPNYLGS